MTTRGETNNPESYPLLTIAIPTWNRAAYLDQNLTQLKRELVGISSELVEIIVSDNCSPDATQGVVARQIHDGLPIRYVRNSENIGWARNFIQCFDMASGKYVYLCGDDDLLVDGALGLLLKHLGEFEYGMVCLRPFGYDNDFRTEHPGGGGGERVFSDSNLFIASISRYFTLTSACVINKSLIHSVDSKEFISTDLVTFHLVLRAALAAEKNLYIDKYLIASKRQNSASYAFGDVFVVQFWRIVDAQTEFGLELSTVRKLEDQRLFSYYPFYLLDMLISKPGNVGAIKQQLEHRFISRSMYRYWLGPILWLPRPLAIAWGALTTLLGRVLAGDLRRGVAFAWSRVSRRLAGPSLEQSS